MKFSGCLAFIVFLFMAAPAIAQEKQDLPHDENYKAHDEPNQPLDPHPNLIRETPKDSITIKPVSTVRPKADGATHKNKAEEETLSFNFLYFIIQKFKVSDIIDN